MSVAINGSGTITGVSAGGLQAGAGPVLMTAQASTSGTSIDFTGIPSWAKRITVMFNGVSSNGANPFLVRVGTSSGVVSSGYLSHSGYIQANTVGSATSTTGYIIINGLAADVFYGMMVIATPGTNTWLASGNAVWDSGTDFSATSNGFVTLSGTLDRIRITTVNGTDTFDAGTINVMYE